MVTLRRRPRIALPTSSTSTAAVLGLGAGTATGLAVFGARAVVGAVLGGLGRGQG